MKKFLSAICAVVSFCCCVAFSACGEKDKLEKVDSEQWRTAIGNTLNSDSYSYDCIYNMHEEYVSGESKEVNINANCNGKVDRINNVTYYEYTDRGSVFPNGSSAGFIFGRYYFSEEDGYYSYINSDGIFGDWNKNSFSFTKENFDILKSFINIIFFQATEQSAEKSIYDLYDSFVFDETNCVYSTVLKISDEADIELKISFKNGRINTLDVISKGNVRSADPDNLEGNITRSEDSYTESTITSVILVSYYFTFFDYNSTVVRLPEELKDL